MKFLLLTLLLITSLYSIDYKVVKIVDGDTINVVESDKPNIKENIIKVRLTFIDTMESVKNNRAKKISKVCGIDINEIIKVGKESKIYLSNLILNKNVTIIFYGMDDLNKRMLGEIYYNNDIDSINQQMISYGKALPYYKYIKKMDPELVDYYKYLYDNSKNEDMILKNECVLNLLKK